MTGATHRTATTHAYASRLAWTLLDSGEWIRVRFAGRAMQASKLVLMLAPSLALVAALAYGVISLLEESFHSYDAVLLQTGPASLEQYGQLFSDPQFLDVLVRTVLAAAISTPITVALAVPVSVFLTRFPSQWIRRLILVAVFLPILMGDVARTFAWLATMAPGGLVSSIWSALGMGALLGTLKGVVLGMVGVQLPIMVLLLLPRAVGIDPELEAAAATLGARPVVAFWQVLFPQMRRATAYASGVCFAIAMSTFADSAILGQGLRDFMSNLLQRWYLVLDQPPRGSAIAAVLLVTIAAGFFAFAGMGGKKNVQ